MTAVVPDMVERVAKAMFVNATGNPDAWERQNPIFWWNAAIAAIAAMREPTKAMKEAGFWDGNVALHTYRAMIDAALEDK